MPKIFNNQAGIAQVLILVIVLAGVVAGTYLVQQRTNLLPKAFDRSSMPVSAPICKAGLKDFNLLNPCKKKDKKDEGDEKKQKYQGAKYTCADEFSGELKLREGEECKDVKHWRKKAKKICQGRSSCGATASARPKPSCLPKPDCVDAPGGKRCLVIEPPEGWCKEPEVSPTCNSDSDCQTGQICSRKTVNCFPATQGGQCPGICVSKDRVECGDKSKPNFGCPQGQTCYLLGIPCQVGKEKECPKSYCQPR